MKKMLIKFLSLKESGVIIGLIVIILFFGVTTKTFFTGINLLNILRQTSLIGILATSVGLLMISGEFDLSVGSTFALIPIVSVVLVDTGFPTGIAFVVSLIVAAVLGFINGLIVTKFKLVSFIVTLGTMMIYRGAVLVISGGRPRPLLSDGFARSLMGDAMMFGVVPIPILWLVLVLLFGWVILHKTTHGYKVFAVGDNLQAAKLSGINTDRIKIINFILAGLTAGLAGIVALCYLGTAAPTQGSGYELQAIAACVIGGIAMFGGSGSVLQVFLGAFILTVIRNGLVLLGVSAYLQNASLGLIILIAVIINVKTAGRREHAF
ncbi:MAG: ABC transporter permease [bacterium]|nr:ABC transporter permease [bacterium]